MKLVGRKVYYDGDTGEIILMTNEMTGDVIETTVEQDCQLYPQLQEVRNLKVKRLYFGQHINEFKAGKQGKLNQLTNQLEFIER